MSLPNNMEPELLEPKRPLMWIEEKQVKIITIAALLFAALSLFVIFFTGKAHADEPTTWEVVECIETDNECLESIGYFDSTVTKESWVVAYEGYEDKASELLTTYPDKSFEELDVMMWDLIEN